VSEHFQDDSDLPTAPQPAKWRGGEWLDNHPVSAFLIVGWLLLAWLILAAAL
jgi:hypothetical protein